MMATGRFGLEFFGEKLSQIHLLQFVLFIFEFVIVLLN